MLTNFNIVINTIQSQYTICNTKLHSKLNNDITTTLLYNMTGSFPFLSSIFLIFILCEIVQNKSLKFKLILVLKREPYSCI